MKKETFVTTMKSFERFENFENLLHQNGVDIIDADAIQDMYLASINLLQDATKDDGEIISYFLFETDFGKEQNMCWCSDEKGKYYFRNLDELWSYLVQQHPEIKDETNINN